MLVLLGGKKNKRNNRELQFSTSQEIFKYDVGI